MSNLPCNVSYDGTPGYYDFTDTETVTCPHCGFTGEMEGEIEPHGRRSWTYKFRSECTNCGEDFQVEGEWIP